MPIYVGENEGGGGEGGREGSDGARRSRGRGTRESRVLDETKCTAKAPPHMLSRIFLR